MNPPPALKDQRHPLLTGIAGILALGLGLALLGNLGLRVLAPKLPGNPWLRAALAVGAAIPLGLAAIRFHRQAATDLDELIQRVLLEGCALGMAGFVLLAGLALNLEAAGLLQWRVDPPDMLLVPILCVGLGIAWRWRRYE